MGAPDALNTRPGADLSAPVFVRARHALPVLAALSLLAGAGGAAAQGRPSVASATAQAAERMRVLGACVAERQPAAAAAALAEGRTTGEARAQAEALVRDNASCAGAKGEGGVNALLFSGALAERLLTNSGVDLPRTLSEHRSKPGTTPDAVAGCMVVADPASVQTLFGTLPASDAERQAFAPLGSALVSCASKGSQLRVPRSGMRALLAMAAWRLAGSTAALTEGPAARPTPKLESGR